MELNHSRMKGAVRVHFSQNHNIIFLMREPEVCDIERLVGRRINEMVGLREGGEEGEKGSVQEVLDRGGALQLLPQA